MSFIQIVVVAKSKESRGLIDPRLGGIDLPRMDIKQERAFAPQVPPHPRPEQTRWNKPEIPAASPGKGRPPGPEVADGEFKETW